MVLVTRCALGVSDPAGRALSLDSTATAFFGRVILRFSTLTTGGIVSIFNGAAFVPKVIYQRSCSSTADESFTIVAKVSSSFRTCVGF